MQGAQFVSVPEVVAKGSCDLCVTRPWGLVDSVGRAAYDPTYGWGDVGNVPTGNAGDRSSSRTRHGRCELCCVRCPSHIADTQSSRQRARHGRVQ
ncbi:hypothetical protein XAB3213_160018 [Xanthomonas citri pv. bilvae]|nr:hypothetical protein XAB3213_160018 [Xanthomonas citri pv. bilvae]